MRLAAVAAAAAALLAGTGSFFFAPPPLPAHAVSGGGGVSNPISGEDLSGRDLRKLRLTKAVMVRVSFVVV
jgi:hypothetical protein